MTYTHGGRQGFGVVSGDAIAPLADGECGSLKAAIAAWGMDGLAEKARTALAGLPRTALSLGSVQWEQPIPDPGKIIGVGLNYVGHAKEAGLSIPGFPALFVRFPSSQAAHESPIVRPAASDQYDFEAELAVIIGRRARSVSAAEADAYIAGYACFADHSLRDFQRHASQATAGKNFERSGAFGPYLVSADEIGDPAMLEVVGRLNGKEVQRDSVSGLIFSIPHLIEYISSFTVLEPGDVIATGTPAGVGMGRTPPMYLQAGDVFEVDIGVVGTLRNTVVDEALA